jgi:hypothetical protein
MPVNRVVSKIEMDMYCVHYGRSAEMREELPATVDQLPPSRPQTWRVL